MTVNKKKGVNAIGLIKNASVVDGAKRFHQKL